MSAGTPTQSAPQPASVMHCAQVVWAAMAHVLSHSLLQQKGSLLHTACSQGPQLANIFMPGCGVHGFMQEPASVLPG